MNMERIARVLLAIAIGMGLGICAAAADPQDEMRIVPVRVLNNGRTVGGLNPADFRVRIGEGELAVTGVDAVKSRLVGEGGGSPRAFAIVLNITSSPVDMVAPLKEFFEKSVRAEDRLLVMTNHFLWPEHHLTDPGMETARIRQMIETEQEWQARLVNRMKTEMDRFVGRFRRGLSNIESQEGESIEFFNVEFPRFIDAYMQFVQELRGQYIQVQPQNFKYLAGFVQSQAGETLVITLFQRGAFPQMRETSNFMKSIQKAMRSSLTANSEFTNMGTWERVMDFQNKFMQMAEQSKLQSHLQIGRSHAIFHTTLLPADYHEDMLTDDFEWRPIPLETEMALCDASRRSGGILDEKGNLQNFFGQLSGREESFYQLKVRAEPSTPPSAANLRVEIPGKEYEALYNSNLLTLRPSADLQVRMENAQIAEGILSFTIKRSPASTPPTVQVTLRMIDQKMQPLLNAQKDFILNSEAEPIRVQLPKIKRGSYDLVITATLPENGGGDFLIQRLKI